MAGSRPCTRRSTAASWRAGTATTTWRRWPTHGIAPIDLVVVNLYPFAEAAARPESPFDDLIEEIDIGGPSLVRAAAKNFRDVLVVVDPADYDRVSGALASAGGPSLALRFELARQAHSPHADYDATIASTLDGVRVDERPAHSRGTGRRG